VDVSIHAVTGVVASLKWGYYFAASINGYTVTIRRNRQTKARTWRLVATVIQCDAFKLTQRPLMFIAPHDKGEWHGEIRAIHFDGADRPPASAPFTITADLDGLIGVEKGTTIYVTTAAMSVRSA